MYLVSCISSAGFRVEYSHGVTYLLIHTLYICLIKYANIFAAFYFILYPFCLSHTDAQKLRLLGSYVVDLNDVIYTPSVNLNSDGILNNFLISKTTGWYKKYYV